MPGKPSRTPQRSKRPGLRQLDQLAATLRREDVVLNTSDPAAVFAAAAEHLRRTPQRTRAALGIFYTPPEVADRLLEDLEAAGARFDGSHTFCDPACGGGAFLLPVARRIARRIRAEGGSVGALARCLIGRDIDPTGVALTRAALDSLARETFGRVAAWDLEVANTLRLAAAGALPVADVVVGNPPFGRVALTLEERKAFSRSLRGHGNLYALFLDVALRISRTLVGFVMPTSWLAGDYFSRLRQLLCAERPPFSARFVEERKGVFEGVLQEMCLAVFSPESGLVRVFSDASGAAWRVRLDGSGPWLIPRRREDAELLQAAVASGTSLKTYGYSVHTGPLVWNRHRDQLLTKPKSGAVPLVWADAVQSNEWIDPARTRRQERWITLRRQQGHLVQEGPAVLVKRTTAKEQARRIVAAPMDLPAVVVENHLNVVRAAGHARVPPDVLCRLLNSEPVDRLFRCLSGTVAVSASELAALPLPPVDALRDVSGAQRPDEVVTRAYLGAADGR